VWFRLSALVTLPKKFWIRVLLLGSVVVQFYAGECTQSVDQALNAGQL